MSEPLPEVRWRYASEFAGTQQLDRRLNDGWEPFAATAHSGSSTRIHLRKAMPSGEQGGTDV